MRYTTLCLLFLAGCGGWDPILNGTWSGPAVVTAGKPGQTQASTYQAQLVLSVSNAFGTATKVCPDGSGRIDFEGSGTDGSWTGLLSCPVPTQQCPQGGFVYRSATMKLQRAGPTLLASMSGDLNLCSAGVVPAKVEFSGTK